jgi:hypothetical protein
VRAPLSHRSARSSSPARSTPSTRATARAHKPYRRDDVYCRPRALNKRSSHRLAWSNARPGVAGACPSTPRRSRHRLATSARVTAPQLSLDCHLTRVTSRPLFARHGTAVALAPRPPLPPSLPPPAHPLRRRLRALEYTKPRESTTTAVRRRRPRVLLCVPLIVRPLLGALIAAAACRRTRFLDAFCELSRHSAQWPRRHRAIRTRRRGESSPGAPLPANGTIQNLCMAPLSSRWN